MDDKDKLNPQKSKATFFAPRSERLHLKGQSEKLTPYKSTMDQNKLLSAALRQNAVRWKDELDLLAKLQRVTAKISSQSPGEVQKLTTTLQKLSNMPFLSEGEALKGTSGN